MSDDNVNATSLCAYIGRIGLLEEERKALSNDIADVYAEAKGSGFDVKIMRKILMLRQDRSWNREDEEILVIYLGSLAGTEV